MKNADDYRGELRALDNWDSYLLEESRLCKPNEYIKLAQVVADEGDLALFQRYLSHPINEDPIESPPEFFLFCGILGFGRLIAEGNRDTLKNLRQYASDPREQIRRAVIMALHTLGDADIEQLIAEMRDWSQGSLLEKKAAVVTVSVRSRLNDPRHAREVLRILDMVTASITKVDDRQSEDFVALCKVLGYCWSNAVATLPADGKGLMEKWLLDSDQDVQVIMQTNLHKERLARMDNGWVHKWQAFALQQKDLADWQLIRKHKRSPYADVHARGIGSRRLQLIVLPSFEESRAWEVRQQKNKWCLFRSDVLSSGLEVKLAGYDPLQIRSSVLSAFFTRIVRLSISLSPDLSAGVGCDGTVNQLAVFGDLSSEWRFQWWSDSPAQWRLLTDVAAEMFNVFTKAEAAGRK